jgi:hypothetical protein
MTKLAVSSKLAHTISFYVLQLNTFLLLDVSLSLFVYIVS